MSDAVQPHSSDSVREDLAFMRAMAEAGSRRPILGGSILVCTGLIYASACVADWLLMIQPTPDIGLRMTWIWASALVLQMAIMAVLILRLRGRGARPADGTNRVFAQAWNGVGLAIMSCLASFFVTAWVAHRPDVFLAYPAVILALYGVGWIVTAASSKQKWTWGVAILSFLFAVGAGAFVGNINLPLLFALALVLLLAAPGAVLIKRAGVNS
ncbi:MAG: hypothetical protein WDN45_00255 [Caulobacteraceae bacterium]